MNQISPATYYFNGSNEKHLGFIAQNVEKHIPLAVDGKKYEYEWERFDENGIIYKIDENGDKIIRPRGLCLQSIVATQMLAIQELSKQIEELRQMIKR